MQEFTVEVEESLGTSLCETKRGDGKNSAWPTSPTVLARFAAVAGVGGVCLLTHRDTPQRSMHKKHTGHMTQDSCCTDLTPCADNTKSPCNRTPDLQCDTTAQHGGTRATARTLRSCLFSNVQAHALPSATLASPLAVVRRCAALTTLRARGRRDCVLPLIKGNEAESDTERERTKRPTWPSPSVPGGTRGLCQGQREQEDVLEEIAYPQPPQYRALVRQSRHPYGREPEHEHNEVEVLVRSVIQKASTAILVSQTQYNVT